MHSRRFVTSILCAAGLVLLISSAAAQTFPSRPVRMVLWGAGSFPDIVARRMAAHLALTWKQPVVADNRAGAAGILAAETGIQAPPDGHTLVWGDPVGWHLYLQQTEPGKGSTAPGSLLPVSLVVDVPMVLFVGAQVPARTLKEFVDYTQSGGQGQFYATPGILTIHHLTLELLAQRTGMKVQHAPYKGMVAIATDVASGRIALSITGLGSIAAFIKDGRLRPIAWTGASRFAAIPDVPTLAESGYPDMVIGIKGGFFVHKDTAPELIERLSRDLAQAARAPDVVEFAERAGALAVGSTPAEFARAAQKDIALFGGIAAQAAAKSR